jgi:F-type H+-transporting ATPase subunit c
MPTDPKAIAYFAAGFGAALTIIGGAAGIGRLASAAMEGIARQPNAAGDIRGSMIVAAGLIEGVTFFSLIVAILLATK